MRQCAVKSLCMMLIEANTDRLNNRATRTPAHFVSPSDGRNYTIGTLSESEINLISILCRVM